MKLWMLFLPIFLLLVEGSSSYASNSFDFYYNQQRPGGDYTNYDVRDVDECARECERDRRCQAFDFDTYNRRCWLKDRVPEVSKNRDIISGVRRGGGHDEDGGKRLPRNIAGLRIQKNIKLFGGDYQNFTVDNVQECAQACARDDRCRSFNYGKERRDCWLKNNVPHSEHNDTVISGVKDGHHSNNEHQTGNNRVGNMRLERNVKRNGGDYTNFTVANVRECARACDRDNKCRSFNYGKERRDCWLKHSTPKGVPNNTVISGVKEH